MPVHVIPDEGDRFIPNEISEKSSDLMYHKKDVDTDTSSYDRVLNALKKLDTSYIPAVQKMHEPVIEGNYKLTVDTRVVSVLEHIDDKIQWKCGTSIYTDGG